MIPASGPNLTAITHIPPRVRRGRKTLVAETSSLHAGDMDDLPDANTETRPGSLRACPDCRASRTVTIRDVDMVAFLCENCGACWRIELGYVQRLKPPEGSVGEKLPE